MRKLRMIFVALLTALFAAAICAFAVGCSEQAGGQGGTTPGGASASINDEEYYIVDIQMVKAPDVSTYSEGDYFNPKGLTLKVIWNDGWEQIIENGANCIFDPTGLITAETESIKVTYDTKTFVLPINVNAIAGIKLKNMPARTMYMEGEEFSTVGMKIVGLNEQGEELREITNYTLSENSSSLTAGQTAVTATYQKGETKYVCEVPISVYSTTAVVVYEAEDGVIVKGEKVKTTGSVLLDYASARGFVRNMKLGGTITINVPATKETKASLRFVASSYEDDPDGGAFTIPLQINEVVGVTFNGVEIPIADDEILSGGYDDARGTNSRYCHWYEVALDEVTLNPGNNTFVITSKVDMTLKDDKNTPDVNEADLHSVLFDCLRAFYADQSAIPASEQPEPEQPAEGVDLTTSVTYQAEKQALSGITTVVKANGDQSGLFTYMEAAGDTDPGFIKNFTSGSTLTISIKLKTAKKVRIVVYGSSTTNKVTNVSSVISKVTLNGTDHTLADGEMFPSWTTIGKTGAAAMADFKAYDLGEYDFSKGDNTFVITFKATEGAFIDKIVIEPVE